MPADNFHKKTGPLDEFRACFYFFDEAGFKIRLLEFKYHVSLELSVVFFVDACLVLEIRQNSLPVF